MINNTCTDCGTQNVNHDPDCEFYVPIDLEAHNARLITQEPERARLNAANTAPALRQRVLATSNGSKETYKSLW